MLSIYEGDIFIFLFFFPKYTSSHILMHVIDKHDNIYIYIYIYI
jgi:hypothetical protein